MNNLSDETLMAFMDGELNEEQAERVRIALEHDALLRDRLKLMQTIDQELREAFATASEVPENIVNLLKTEPSAKVVNLGPRPRNWAARAWIPAGAAVAAGFAGVIAGSLLTTGSTAWLRRVDDGIAVASAVQNVVAHAPSGKSVQADGLNVTPVLSFVARDGRMCREMHLKDGELAARIVACKDDGEDEWCIEAFARVPVQDDSPGYRTAGAPKDPVIDAAFARLGVKATLDAKEEGAAIARDWSQH